ncbi:hypothetical protein AB4853_15395 [Bradyrhizobium sp. 1050_B9_N1_2]|uniref:hypothetical protein n=1 Tax=Bradyrhizobium sp. 1050_B9_N1_2 TaxID=3238688 RepID=UPI003EDBCD88
MTLVIPLELQRRHEKRWAARFFRPIPATPQPPLEGRDQQLPPTVAPALTEVKAHRSLPDKFVDVAEQLAVRAVEVMGPAS